MKTTIRAINAPLTPASSVKADAMRGPTATPKRSPMNPPPYSNACLRNPLRHPLNAANATSAMKSTSTRFTSRAETRHERPDGQSTDQERNGAERDPRNGFEAGTSETVGQHEQRGRE